MITICIFATSNPSASYRLSSHKMHRSIIQILGEFIFDSIFSCTCTSCSTIWCFVIFVFLLLLHLSPPLSLPCYFVLWQIKKRCYKTKTCNHGTQITQLCIGWLQLLHCRHNSLQEVKVRLVKAVSLQPRFGQSIKLRHQTLQVIMVLCIFQGKFLKRVQGLGSGWKPYWPCSWRLEQGPEVCVKVPSPWKQPWTSF